jgi:hypothetical protein
MSITHAETAAPGATAGHGAAAMGRMRTAVHTVTGLGLAPHEVIARLDSLAPHLSYVIDSMRHEASPRTTSLSCSSAPAPPVRNRAPAPIQGRQVLLSRDNHSQRHPAASYVRPAGPRPAGLLAATQSRSSARAHGCALAGDLFNHGAEQDVPVFAVLPATSRLELGSPIAAQPQVVNERAEFQAVRPGLAAEDVACNMLIGVAQEHQGAPGLPEHRKLTFPPFSCLA